MFTKNNYLEPEKVHYPLIRDTTQNQHFFGHFKIVKYRLNNSMIGLDRDTSKCGWAHPKEIAQHNRKLLGFYSSLIFTLVAHLVNPHPHPLNATSLNVLEKKIKERWRKYDKERILTIVNEFCLLSHTIQPFNPGLRCINLHKCDKHPVRNLLHYEAHSDDLIVRENMNI